MFRPDASRSDLESAKTLQASASDAPIRDVAPTLDDADEPRYEPGPLLGRGGMGEVTLQLDRRVGRPIAKKTLRDDLRSTDALARFVREGRVQGQLEHPSIVPVYDLGTDGDARVYFTMKRIRGTTLADVIEQLAKGDEETTARFTQRKLLAAFVQVCLTIEYAHKRGVIHRDLKPQNLMLGDFGEVYVLDWGIAKLLSERSTPSGEIPVIDRDSLEVTQAGDLVGTPQYMAPEQLSAGQRVDARADVFTLGEILFELLTLTPYRSVASMPTLLATALRAEVERPSSRRSGVPPELDEACAHALASDPADRTATAAALADAVESYLEGDRDRAQRAAQAARHLELARTRLSAAADDATKRVEAMREALKAIALVPEDEAAQRLLLSLVVDGTGKLPQDAEKEFAETEVRARLQGARAGLAGYASWLGALPLAIWVGIRNWTAPLWLTGLTLACMAFTVNEIRLGARSPARGFVLAILTASVVAISSCWLGPFVLTPLAATASAVMFIVHSTRRERPYLLAVWSLAALAPFVIELLRVLPPAYSFRAGEIVLHPRSLEVPQGPTLLTLAYTTLSFLLLLGVFVGRLRDRQSEAERRLFVQAWHLRQLFGH